MFSFQGHGLDDKRIKYFPFRDDVKVILKVYDCFIDKLVDSYYKSFVSNRVRYDKELQSWANELSIHGKKQPDGGKGKVNISSTLDSVLFPLFSFVSSKNN